MMVATMGRSGMPFIPRTRFHRLVTERGLGDLFCARQDGAMQGCALILRDETCAWYLYGGSAGSAVLGSQNLLLWEVIR